jgi:RimJ/RimL family protein N-acetyltransferase
VNEKDIHEVAQLMLRPEVLRWDMDYRSHEYDVETMIQKLRDFFVNIRKDANHHCLLVKLDGRVVAFLGIHRFSDPKNHVGDVGIIVDPDHQQKDVGSRLLEAGIELARKEKFRRLEADTLAENRAMRKLAEKTGFQLEGIKEKT